MSDSSFFSQSGSNEATATTINTKVNEAEAAKAAAEAAQAAAEAARDLANASAVDAQSSEDDAETAQAASEAARDTSATSAAAASASAATASSYSDDARKLAIETEDTQYQLSDGTTGYSALHYYEKAEDSAAAAAVSAGTASTDAGTASQDAATATTKAGEASASASAASQSEQNAAQSETNAAQSEANASQSEANASQSETNASQSEVNAGQSETNAAVSAGTASTDAATATTKAGEASASAAAALQSEQNASQSETNAGQSETNAAQSEANASQSEANASQSEANASQSEANASQSETNAAASASTATTQAGIATTQAGISTAQAGTATTKAGEASNSASSALTAQTAAEAARDSALSALDSFDDRYLGVKSSAPTVDNDGDTLQQGALFYSSTDTAMKVWDGSQWLNAYASLSGALMATQNLSDLNNAAIARTNLGLAAVASSGAYSDLTGTPTTVAGYGITDAFDGAFSSLTGKPTTVAGYGITDAFDGAFSSLTGKPTTVAGYGITDAFDGAFSSLTGKPTTVAGYGITDAFDGAYSSLTGVPSLATVATSGAYSDLSGTPSLSAVATSGNYSDLSGTPSLSAVATSGNYSDLSGTPTIPTNNNQLTNGAGYITSADGGNAATLDGIDSTSFLRSDTSDTATGTHTFDDLRADGGNLILGDDAYAASAVYVGMKTSFQSGTNDYMIISGTTDGNTYISAKDGSSVNIRGGGNFSSNELTVPDNGAPTIGGSTIWHAGNDGSGSGLDADTVDGIQASSFLRSDASDTVNAGVTYTWSATNTAGLKFTNASYAKSLEIGGWTNANTSGVSRIRNSNDNLHLDAGSAGHMYLNHYCTGNVYIRGSLAWHAGNDGSGSGLDADLLDGYHANTSRSVANTIPVRDQYGYLQLGWINTTSGNTNSNAIDRVYSSYDGYIRYSNATNFLHRQGLSYYRAYNWLEFRDTGAGLYWSNSTGAGWHIYPQSTAYMRFRSGHSSAAGIRCNTNGTDRNYIYWNSSNQVGFLTTGGGWAFKCDNSGNVTATGNVTAYSDIRLKTDIEPIEGALDRVSKLEGVEYTRKATGEREMGFIAQNVITHEPSLVDVVDASTEEQEALPDLHVMKYQNTTALLVEAVKELKAEVDTLRQEIAELKKES